MTDTIFSTCGVDLELEANGVWVPLAINEKIKIKLRSAQCEEFQRAVFANNQKNARILDKKKRSFGEEKRIQDSLIEAVVSTLVVDWEGVVGEDGKAIKFSREAAKKILLDKRLRKVTEEIVEAATYEETFASDDDLSTAEVTEAIEGN